MIPYLTWTKTLAPEHCRVCGVNKHSHGQRYTPDCYRDQIPDECIPHFDRHLSNPTAYHFYVPITMAEFKEYLLRKRNDNTS